MHYSMSNVYVSYEHQHCPPPLHEDTCPVDREMFLNNIYPIHDKTPQKLLTFLMYKLVPQAQVISLK